MSANSKIEWTDHTFNPWIGCTKVSPGCDHCYAARQDAFRQWTAEGWGGARRRTKTWGDPVKWNAQASAFAAQHGRRQRVFCASLADVFDNAVDPEWRADLIALIEATPMLDWLLLTKRIGNVKSMTPEWTLGSWPLNVWLGATIVNQEEADRDIPKLLAVPARVRFLSVEPMLGPIGIRRFLFKESSPLSWVIAGGESGPKARPMHPDWPRDLRDQCQEASVPFFFKQWGEWAPQYYVDADSGRALLKMTWTKRETTIGGPTEGTKPTNMARVGKKAAGRLLDGRTWDGTP